MIPEFEHLTLAERLAPSPGPPINTLPSPSLDEETCVTSVANLNPITQAPLPFKKNPNSLWMDAVVIDERKSTRKSCIGPKRILQESPPPPSTGSSSKHLKTSRSASTIMLDDAPIFDLRNYSVKEGSKVGSRLLPGIIGRVRTSFCT